MGEGIESRPIGLEASEGLDAEKERSINSMANSVNCTFVIYRSKWAMDINPMENYNIILCIYLAYKLPK